MAKKKSLALTYDDILKMSHEQKAQIATQLAKRANTRLGSLRKAQGEKSAQYAQASAEVYLRQQKRNKFYEGKKYKTEQQLNRALNELNFFLNRKTSTLSGLRQVEQQRLDTFKKKYEIEFTTKKDKDEFFNFLNSKQYEDLRKNASSEQIQQMYNDAQDAGLKKKEILNAFKDFKLQTQENDLVEYFKGNVLS